MKVALYQPDIAQNLGAIMRSCACFGVDLSVIEPCGFPLTAKGIRKAAMDYGAPETLTRHANWEAFHARGRSEFESPSHKPQSNAVGNAGRTVLFTTKGATPLPDFAFRVDDTLLFGRESAGVPDHVHNAVHARVIIPIATEARSFNLSVSVAIALFEALRQTGGLPAK